MVEVRLRVVEEGDRERGGGVELVDTDAVPLPSPKR
jgi:hypothetical protein